jgi:hypothetical protein
MEVTFACGTLAEVAGDDARWFVRVLEGLEFQCIGGA